MKIISEAQLMRKIERIPNWVLLVFFFLGIGMIAYLFKRGDFFSIAGAFYLSFLAYLLLYQKARSGHYSIKNGFLAIVLIRFSLIFALPSLSDDFYRFLFDGHLFINGYNPYLNIPEDWVGLHGLQKGDSFFDLFQNMNSPTYYSVYPPLHQVFFAIAAFSGETILANVIVLRLLILVFELLNVFLIYKLLKLWKMPVYRSLLYGLNPLVILELTGNLHFEGIVLTGLLTSLYFFERHKVKWAAGSWVWAVAIKLTPLILGPVLWRKAFQLKFSFSFLAWVFLFLFIALGGLFVKGAYANLWESIQLYSAKFEFNASIYYLIRWVSGFFMDYNPIGYVGPFLSILTLLIVLGMSFLLKIDTGKDLAKGIVWIYLVYLMLQTVVHPWYLIPAFGVSVLTGNRVFLLWTGSVFLSYNAYQTEEVLENTVLLVAQYLPLYFYALWIWLNTTLHNRI